MTKETSPRKSREIIVWFEIVFGVVLALVARCAIAYLAYYLVKKKGYKAGIWFLIGLLLGWIGVFLAILKTENRRNYENDDAKHYVDQLAREKVNYAIYRMHNFVIANGLVLGISGPFIFSLASSIIFVIFETRFPYMERLKAIVVIIGIIMLVAAIDFIILYLIFYQWKKVNHINAVLHNAKELKLYGDIIEGKEYTDSDYLCDIGADVQKGMLYQSTYLSISENYIFGIVWADENTFTFIPVVVPRKMITKIYCDYSGYWASVPGGGGNLISAVAGNRTYRYTGGYNVYLNNGKKVVIAYGNKHAMGRTRKELEKTGILVE